MDLHICPEGLSLVDAQPQILPGARIACRDAAALLISELPAREEDMKIRRPSNKMNQRRPESKWAKQIRIYHRKARKKMSPRYLLKCGCCHEHVEIHYSDDGDDDASLSIGGVLESIENWREILLPLLNAPGAMRARKRKGGSLKNEKASTVSRTRKGAS